MTESSIRARQRAFDDAELHADAAALEELLTDDFLSIGPKGFVLDKRQWIDRHQQFEYRTLEVSDVDVRCYDGAAIVRNVQHNIATYRNQPVDVRVRVSLLRFDVRERHRTRSLSRDQTRPGRSDLATHVHVVPVRRFVTRRRIPTVRAREIRNGR
jgi:hypothetical protein